MTNSSLKIFSWNCRSICNKLSQFKYHIYINKPHIICLTETWIRPPREPQLINYSPFFHHRLSSTGGGLAFYIRNDIMCLEKPLNKFENGKLEIQAVTIISNNDKIDILNLYNPNENISKEEFRFYFEQLGSSHIVSGDFNGHHSLWDDRQMANPTGRNLADILAEFDNLSLLTPKNFPTYYNIQNNSYSTLDLTIVSANLCNISSVSIGKDLGSDHFPVILEISVNLQMYTGKRRIKWIFDSDLWNRFTSLLPEVESKPSLQEKYDFFVNSILETGKRVFKLTKEVYNIKYSKPWWNPDCERLISENHRAKNRFKNHPTTENYNLFKTKEKEASRIIKLSKEKSFKQFCNEINSNTPDKIIWNKIAALSKKYKPFRPTPIKFNDQLITCPKTKANKLAENFEKELNIKSVSEISSQILIPSSIALIDECTDGYNMEITIDEMQDSISKLKPTCPGSDLIHNNFLKKLPKQYLEYLLNIFNLSFSTGKILKSWKSSIVIPTVKPDKDIMLTDSYRPISLLPCIPKLLEKIINKRLNFHLESNFKLSSSQNGFRKRLSTIDQIAKLENCIRTTYIERKICLVIFIDLSKAYDTIWHAGLIYKLQQSGLKGKILKWIYEYISNRTFNVFFEGEYSCEKDITSGVPQGSSLSPTLFNVMINDIPKLQGVVLSEYADDITFYCYGDSFNELKTLAQKQIDTLFKWTKTWGLKINAAKTKAMIFTNKRLGTPSNVYLNEVPIQYVKTYKYLGMIFDAPSLKWRDHVEYIRDSSLPRINMLKCISGKQWGADRNMLIRLYKSIIRSRLDYGSMFYNSANHSHIQKLDVIQNTCIRLAIGAQKSSPILSIEVESNVPPLKIHRLMTLLKYYCRLSELPKDISCCKVISNNINYLLTKNWSSNKIAPAIIRAIKHFETLKLTAYPFQPSPLITPIPPWVNLDKICKPYFSVQPVANISDSMAQQIFISLKEDFNPTVEIYTDGSKIIVQDPSCSAAVIIKTDSDTVMYNYRLPPETEILGCELFAIKQALLYIKEEYFDKSISVDRIAIYSDSLSSIKIIKNPCPRNYIYLVFSIHKLLKTMMDIINIVIQFIPGHKNIQGNEMADLAANAAHCNETILAVPLSYNEKVRYIHKAVLDLWQTNWRQMVDITNKGKHLTTIKSQVGHWPWSCHRNRTVETVFAKLRIGHANFNQNLFRFNLAPSPFCRCGYIESVDHMFTQCSLYAEERTDLYETLIKSNINFTIMNLLGGGNFEIETQKFIMNNVAKYLFKIKKLHTL